VASDEFHDGDTVEWDVWGREGGLRTFRGRLVEAQTPPLVQTFSVVPEDPEGGGLRFLWRPGDIGPLRKVSSA